MFATLDFCKNLAMHHAEKNKNVIYRLGRSVLEKYFVEVSTPWSVLKKELFWPAGQDIVKSRPLVQPIKLQEITKYCLPQPVCCKLQPGNLLFYLNPTALVLFNNHLSLYLQDYQ